MSYSIKPYVNINPDESIVAHKLKEVFKGSNVFIPIKDNGIDLILIKENESKKAIRIQVKGSKHHYREDINSPNARGWVTITSSKLDTYCDMVDFIIFIIHKIETDRKNHLKFNEYYVIIPPPELRDLAKKYKKKGSKGEYHFYFTKKADDLVDNRDVEYSLKKYLNNWDLI
jgi:hypothetical protein